MLAGMAFIREHQPETLTVTSFDGLKLSATFVPHPGARGTLLLFHGYRSSALVDFAISAPFYWAQGFNLLLPDEPQPAGASEGRYITFGVRERRDVESWVGVMAARLGPEEPLYLGGLSMGGRDGAHGVRVRLPRERAGASSPTAASPRRTRSRSP
jgi:alpha-beta hydrolase superfamily lysophospholipase